LVHVKKVEIFGFKSFGFKNTTVQFETDANITGFNVTIGDKDAESL